MDAVVARVEITHESILSGDHHIITAVALEDGITKANAGTMLRNGKDGYTPCTGQPVIITPAEGSNPAATEDEDPAAILLEGVTGATASAVQPAAVHGAIRRSKVFFLDGTTPVTDEYIKRLRKNGIYVIEG